jgi:farnesyl-diphosphate farnesyltransferase
MKNKDISLTKAQKGYLNASMNRVSRSFALVTPCLEDPLNDFMAVAYLVCRVVDNIEDCGRPLDWKRLRYSEFNQLLSEPAQAREVLSCWEAEDWPGLTSDEKQMMSIGGGLPLWLIYAQAPDEIRSTIRNWSSSMAEGMENTEDPDRPPTFINCRGVRLLERKWDYDQYCYYVAGTVGHMTTELVISHYGLTGKTGSVLTDLCEACGRGLQKTNIIKDFKNDLERGICYLPGEWMRDAMFSPLSLAGAPLSFKQKVIKDVLRELRDFVSYFAALPREAAGYRLASLMCLLPAYQTILKAARNHEKLFTPEHQVKVSRLTFYRCIRDAKSMARSNEAVLRYAQEIERMIERAFEGAKSALAIEIENEKSSRPDPHHLSA